LVPELPAELEAVLNRVTAKQREADRKHQSYRTQWEKLYGLYRGYSDWKAGYSQAGPRDRDPGLGDAKREWGAELFIPYSFATVETILPRALSNRPKMLVLPRNRASEANVQHMKGLIDGQQEQIRYELKLMDTAKSGFIYGLGVQKVLWRKEYTKRKALVAATQPGHPKSDPKGTGYVQGEKEVCVFDDPDVENVDIFDFFWDPAGHCIEACEWVIHRTWRSDDYVAKKLGSGDWNNPAGLEMADAEGLGSNRREELVAERQRIAGLAV